MTWEDLLTTKAGRDVGKGLVTAVINQQISQQISVRSFFATHTVYVADLFQRLILLVKSCNRGVRISAVPMMSCYIRFVNDGMAR